VLLAHPNRVLNRDQLLDLTQGREADPLDRAIDVQISRLRHRLGTTRAIRGSSRPCGARAMCWPCR
jgi:DNA-binding response OmpR family regulator